jgi:ABC-2 type transport system ATP-binding protein
VLRGVSLAVPVGSVTALLGPNGAGKTTLLRILAATVSPDAGRVTILGHDAIRFPYRVRRRIGFALAEERSFFWRLTARQNLRFFGTLADLHGAALGDRVAELAGLLEIAPEMGKPFRDLSTGMRQRLGLARALLHDPEVLLVDEPTRGLDPGAARRARRLLREVLVDGMNKTVLLATHNLEEAREVADRVAFLKGGVLLHEGPTGETIAHVPEVFDLPEGEG